MGSGPGWRPPTFGRERIARYVADMPLISDRLREALSQFGQSLGDYPDRR